MMSACDKTKRRFSGGAPERVGLMDNIWSDALRKWLTQGYPTKQVMAMRQRRVREGARVDLDEESPRPVEWSGRRVSLAVRGREIVTLRIVPAAD